MVREEQNSKSSSTASESLLNSIEFMRPLITTIPERSATVRTALIDEANSQITSPLEMNWAFKIIHHDDTRVIRQAVLWPGKRLDQVVVNGDESALHIGVFAKDHHVGTISLFLDGEAMQFRKLAILPAFQNSGAGTALMAACTDIASKWGANQIWCNARQDALNFYIKRGFEIDSNVFALSDVFYQKAFLNAPFPKIPLKDIFIQGIKALVEEVKPIPN